MIGILYNGGEEVEKYPILYDLNEKGISMQLLWIDMRVACICKQSRVRILKSLALYKM